MKFNSQMFFVNRCLFLCQYGNHATRCEEEIIELKLIEK